MPTIQDAISNVNGNIGIAAKHLLTGQQFRQNQDELFFTASTLKIPLAIALYRLVEQGKIDLAEHIEVTDEIRVPGSSILKELGAGLRPTIQDLAMLMIIVSDNTATDLIFERVGKPFLNSTLADLNLSNTRIPMTTRELLYNIIGLDPGDKTTTYKQASRLLQEQRFLSDAEGFQVSRSDVSTPSDMIKMCEAIYSGGMLNDTSRESLINILCRQQFNSVIPLLLPPGTKVAHKTGSYHNVRCDVGIVFAENGPYTIALMAKDLYGNTLEIDLSMARVSKAIHDEFRQDD